MNNFKIPPHRLKIKTVRVKTLFPVCILLCVVYLFSFYETNTVVYKLAEIYVLKSENTELVTQKAGEFFKPSNKKRKDWHDYTQIYMERQRNGIGEQGNAALSSKEVKALNRSIFKEYGYNAILSEKISLNRSVPDVRHADCKKKLYLETLPRVSVIIPFYKEHWSTILRTVFSILNRSPVELVKEIFLVNDGYNEDDIDKTIYEKLQNNLQKVKLIHELNHRGLAAARVVGAKAASSSVLVFLDAHTEVNVNWLPPLIEPIAFDEKTVVVPIIDEMAPGSLKYRNEDDGARGTFDWDFSFHRLSLTPKDKVNMPEPFETPVMLGGMFAIARAFFFTLGGYDPDLNDWGGEQYELSFKIWMCGGRMLEAPCSRVGHLYRYPPNDRETRSARNCRRVAEVWMDEYKEYLFLRRPDVRGSDPGDLTQQKAIRKMLGCKPFKWFMTQVAFDLTQRFPLIEPKPYAEGRIRPSANPHLCVDGHQGSRSTIFVLRPCHPIDKPIPIEMDEQKFELTWFNDVKLKTREDCWEYRDCLPNNKNVVIFGCHHSGGNQQWRYYLDTKHFVFVKSALCLDHNAMTFELFVSPCDEKSVTQRWDIDIVYIDQLAQWNENHTISITGPKEAWNVTDAVTAK